MTIRSIVLIPVLMILSVCDTVSASGDGVFPFKIEEATLENGLRVFLIPTPSDGLVSYWTLVRTGSRDEVDDGASGFAHFFEHMMFRGEQENSDIDQHKTPIVERSAGTSDDFTSYYANVARDDLPQVIRNEAHRFKNLSYSEDVFRTEAGAVFGEYTKDRTSPWTALDEVLLDTAFRVHPYKHLVLGLKEDIRRMPEMYDYSKQFYERFYRPDNIIILVIGDFDPAQTLTLIREKYADFEPGYVPPDVPVEPKQTRQRRAEVQFQGDTEPTFAIAFKSPSFAPDDRTFMAGTLLGELIAGRLSPLHKKLVLDQQRATGLWSWFGLNRDPRLWGISVRVKNTADVPSVEAEIWQAVDEIRRTPVSAKRLDAVRSYVKYRFLGHLRSPHDIGSAIARVSAITGDPGQINTMYKTLSEVTPVDIQAAASTWLERTRSTIVALYFDQAKPPSSLTEVIPSVLMPVPDDPLITIKLGFKVGSQDEPPGKEGLAALASWMLVRAGSEHQTYEELLRKRQPLGARLSLSVDKELTTICWTVHRDNLNAFYDLLIESLLEPGFRETDFDRFREAAFRRVTQRFLTESDEELSNFALHAEVFRNTPYEHHMQGTPESLPSLTVEDVREFYRKFYNRNNVVLGLSGNYPASLPERLKSDLVRLGEGPVLERAPLRLEPIRGRKVILVDKESAPVSVNFGFPIDVRRGSREYYALAVANTWFGHHRKGFGRLFNVIREQRGLNYGNYSYIEFFKWRGWTVLPRTGLVRQQQLFEVWIRSLPREHALFALRAALRELDKLIENGLSQEQFNDAVDYYIRFSRYLAQDTTSQLGYAIDDYYYRIEEGHLNRLRRIAAELTVDEVNAAIRKHLQSENMVIAIVTDDADGMAKALVENKSSPVRYEQTVSDELLAEDREIERYPLNIATDSIKVIAPGDVLSKHSSPPLLNQ